METAYGPPALGLLTCRSSAWKGPMSQAHPVSAQGPLWIFFWTSPPLLSSRAQPPDTSLTWPPTQSPTTPTSSARSREELVGHCQITGLAAQAPHLGKKGASPCKRGL